MYRFYSNFTPLSIQDSTGFSICRGSQSPFFFWILRDDHTVLHCEHSYNDHMTFKTTIIKSMLT